MLMMPVRILPAHEIGGTLQRNSFRFFLVSLYPVQHKKNNSFFFFSPVKLCCCFSFQRDCFLPPCDFFCRNTTHSLALLPSGLLSHDSSRTKRTQRRNTRSSDGHRTVLHHYLQVVFSLAHTCAAQSTDCKREGLYFCLRYTTAVLFASFFFETHCCTLRLNLRTPKF